MTPSSVCTNHVARQQGQAIVEALLVLPLMAALIWGVTWVGGLQFSAQQLAHASRKAAMAGALGQHATPLHSFAAARQTRQMRDLDGVATPSLSRLQREWFGEGLRLMAVYAQSAHSSSGALRSPSITRHTHVAVGSGHAFSDHDARHRIAKPSDGWRRAEQMSLAAAHRMAPQLQRMDRPWGRPALRTDWLSGWADVVPQGRLTPQQEQFR